MPGKGKPFEKGDPRAGRPKGKLNRATEIMRGVAAKCCTDKEYQKKLLADFRARKVHPSVEQMMWAYFAGKPKDTLVIEEAPPLLSVDELTEQDIANLRRERDES